MILKYPKLNSYENLFFFCPSGVCQANDPDLILQAGVEELVPISTLREENATVVEQSKVTTQGAPQNVKGKTRYYKQRNEKSTFSASVAGSLTFVCAFVCVCWFRSGRRELSEIFRLHGGSVLCPALLVQDMQASAERWPGVHEAQAERPSQSGDLPAVRLRGRSELQDAEGRSQQGITKPPHMPETLRYSTRGLFN